MHMILSAGKSLVVIACNISYGDMRAGHWTSHDLPQSINLSFPADGRILILNFIICFAAADCGSFPRVLRRLPPVWSERTHVLHPLTILQLHQHGGPACVDKHMATPMRVLVSLLTSATYKNNNVPCSHWKHAAILNYTVPQIIQKIWGYFAMAFLYFTQLASLFH